MKCVVCVCGRNRYGAFDAWLVTATGGMSTVSNTTSTAWEHIIVHTEPAAVTKLTAGSYSIDTRFGPTQVRWQYGRLDNESTTNTLVTNLSLPVGSTAEVVHDAQLDRGGCELHAVLESGVTLWSSADEQGEHGAVPQGVLGPPAAALEGAGGARGATGGGGRPQARTTVGSGVFSFEAQYACGA